MRLRHLIAVVLVGLICGCEAQVQSLQGSETATTTGGTSTHGSSAGTTGGSGSHTGSTGGSATTTSSTTGAATSGTTGSTSGYWVSGYYVGWEPQRLPPSRIDYSALTHIINFALTPNQSNGQLNDPYPLDNNVVTTAHSAGKKALVSIGTAFQGLSATSRSTLIENITSYVRNHGYDGADIDWEDDPTNLTDFLSKLRTRFDQVNRSWMITMPIALGPKPNNDPDPTAHTYATAAAYCDQVNLMTYDMSGNYDGWVTWHSSPLYNGGFTFPISSSSNPYYLPSADQVVQRLVAAGLPARKIGLGIGFVGQRWHGATAPQQSVTGITGVDDDVYYAEIMSTDLPNAQQHYDSSAEVPYLSNTRDNTFLSYENAQSIAAKAAYIKSKGLGGGMIWQLNAGYANGTAPTQGDLLQAVKTGLR